MDGLAVFDYDDGGESEYRAPSIGRQKQVRPTNWSAEVELVLDTTYTGASSQEKEDKIVADVKEALVDVITSAVKTLFVAMAANFKFLVTFMEGDHSVHVDKFDLRIYFQFKEQTTQARLSSCTKQVPATIKWRPLVGGLGSDPLFMSDKDTRPPNKFIVMHGEHKANNAAKRTVIFCFMVLCLYAC